MYFVVKEIPKDELKYLSNTRFKVFCLYFNSAKLSEQVLYFNPLH